MQAVQVYWFVQVLQFNSQANIRFNIKWEFKNCKKKLKKKEI